MANLSTEMKRLYEEGLFPKSNYFSTERFATHYNNTQEFWYGLIKPIRLPILNALSAGYYALRAVWATLRAIGNLLILKPGPVGAALNDLAVHSSLSIALAVMAPIHVLSASLELLTRTISSWFGPEEPEVLSASVYAKYIEEVKELNKLAPFPPFTNTYISGPKFFTPYKEIGKFFSGLISPIAVPLETGYHSLHQASKGVIAALNCMANLLICKPNHTYESANDVGVHLSLAVYLAVMTPVNMIVEAMAVITCLGTTWFSACTDSEEPSSPSYPST